MNRQELARRYALIDPLGESELDAAGFSEALAVTRRCIEADRQEAGALILDAAGWGTEDGTAPGSELWETAGTLRRGEVTP